MVASGAAGGNRGPDGSDEEGYAVVGCYLPLVMLQSNLLVPSIREMLGPGKLRKIQPALSRPLRCRGTFGRPTRDS